MNTVPNLNKATVATAQSKVAAASQLKLASRGYAIDPPDSEHEERLTVDALGRADATRYSIITATNLLPRIEIDRHIAVAETSSRQRKLQCPQGLTIMLSGDRERVMCDAN